MKFFVFCIHKMIDYRRKLIFREVFTILENNIQEKIKIKYIFTFRYKYKMIK